MKKIVALALVLGLAFVSSAMAAHTCGQMGGSCLPHDFNPGGPGLPGPFPTPPIPTPTPMPAPVPIEIEAPNPAVSPGIKMPTYPNK